MIWRIKLCLTIGFILLCLPIHLYIRHCISSNELWKDFDAVKGRVTLPSTPSEPDCNALFHNASEEVLEEARSWKIIPNWSLADRDLYRDLRRNCENFLRERNYFLNSSSQEEASFPIAYSIVRFRDVVQFERLFRLLYRPWNFYCLHIELEYDTIFTVVEELAVCVNSWSHNVINSQRREMISSLDADIICMEALQQFTGWKYFINLAGEEFPLKTNWELVRILKALHGASNVEALFFFNTNGPRRTTKKKFPFSVHWYRGCGHILARREFTEFVVRDPRAHMLLEVLRENQWLRDKEGFFSTIYMTPQFRIPGNIIGLQDDLSKPQQHTPLVARFSISSQNRCRSGRMEHGVCVLGVENLAGLIRSRSLFANSFLASFEPVAMRCLELEYDRRISEEYRQGRSAVSRDAQQFYSNLFFVRHRYRGLTNWTDN